MKIKPNLSLYFVFFFGVLLVRLSSIAQIESFENDMFRVREIMLGAESAGSHLFSATVINRSSLKKNFVINIRTECLGLGRSNWQREFFFILEPHEIKKVKAEYEVMTPMFNRITLRFGEAEKYVDTGKWLNLSGEEKAKNRITFFWTKNVLPRVGSLDERILREWVSQYNVYLNPISLDRLSQIKEGLSGLIKKSRTEDPLRDKLGRFFHITREYPQDYDYHKEAWEKDFSFLESKFENQQISTDIFSISGDADNRISAFIASRKKDVYEKKPIIFLISGNPPGTKESLVNDSLFFAKLGYHTVGIDRRKTSRILDQKEKFLTNFSDPISDLLRLIGFFYSQSKYPFSNIGIYGFSMGAAEGKFVAALSDRISAVVLACGIASHNSLFKDEAWFPTYSGMIIFPELGLGKPDIANLTPEQFRENLNKLKPEHHAKAREIYRKEFPYFEDLDSLKTTPLIAPVPLLIITGAQDDQFNPSGVVEVDQAVQNAYRKFGLSACSELYIQPRVSHTVDSTAGLVIAAFFERWLK
jgi:pimeloyl-ACP methyl ester carboxylesterase